MRGDTFTNLAFKTFNKHTYDIYDQETITGITVERLLTIPKLHDINPIYIPPHYSTEIKNVSVIEVEDFYTWIRGGELALTTLQSFPTKELQIKVVDQLAKGGAACLAFHPTDQKYCLHNEAIEYAKKCNFPILMFQSSMPYIDVIEAVFDVIKYKQNTLLQKSALIYQKLTEYLLLESSVDKMIELLCNSIQKPIILTDINLDTVSCFTLKGNISLDLDTIQLKEYLNQKETFHTLLGKSYLEINTVNENNPNQWLVAPIIVKNEIDKYLFIQGEIKQEDYAAIEQTIATLSIDSLKRKSIKDEKQNLMLELINELLEKETPEINSIEQKGNKLGINIHNEKHIIVVTFEEFENPSFFENNQLFIENIKKQISSNLERSVLYSSDFIAWYNQELVIFTSLTQRHQLQNFVVLVKKNIETNFNQFSFCIGISNIHASPLNLRKGYNEAKAAIKINNQIASNNVITFFNDIGFYQILTDISNDRYIKTFYTSILAPLLDTNEEKSTEFLNTLEAFLNSNQSFKDTSKLLFVHVNTVKYRIQRIKEIYGENIFESPQKCFDIQAALKLYKLKKCKN